MPGFEQTWQKDPFHPAFLKRWKGLRLLPLHGLDAHQRLGDQHVERPADAAARDLLQARRGPGVDDRVVQPPEDRSVVLHAAPGRRRFRAPLRPDGQGAARPVAEDLHRVLERGLERPVQAEPLRGRAGREARPRPEGEAMGGRLALHGRALDGDLQDLGRGLRRPRPVRPRAAVAGRQHGRFAKACSASATPPSTPTPWPSRPTCPTASAAARRPTSASR